MITKIIECPHCCAKLEIHNYRKIIVCPYCKSDFEFEGFNYRIIDRNNSMFAHIKYEQDCPVCRSKHMFLNSSKMYWKCIDCGYMISSLKQLFSIFWFCDKCETFMNIQSGFNTKKGKWTCTECGFENNTTKKDIL